MRERKKLSSAVLILVVLSVLFMGAKARRDNEVTFNGSQFDLPKYSVRGTHQVGWRELAIGGDNPLAVTMWYPGAAKPAIETEKQGSTSYRYEIKLGDPFGTVAIASFAGMAISDAPYDLSNGPFPLVILSPGFSVGSSSYGWIAEHLASYGFVVVSPDHDENLDPENELWRAAIERPLDVLSVFDYVDRQTQSGGKFEGLINTELVGVIGHSYGGYTALASSGAQVDSESLKAHCKNAQEAKDPSAWLCDVLLPRLSDMAELAGLDSVPESIWPNWADTRVDAIVSMAGDAFFFGQAGLSKIDVPVMAIGGTLDEDSPFMSNTHPTYEYVSSQMRVKVALTDAEHMIFTGPCESNPWYLRFFSGEFCSDSHWERDYAHGLVGHFTAAFLLAELNQDVTAAAELAPETIDYPGVAYDAQGY